MPFNASGLAGQEAKSFAQRIRNSSEDFVRCELAAVERFKLNYGKRRVTRP